MRTLTRDEIQKIRMCIKTYLNINGVMPAMADMIEWLGADYAPLLALYNENPFAA